MPLKTACPVCHTSYFLEDDQAGKTVRCRKCQATFSVRGPHRRPGRDEEVREESAGRRYDDEREEDRPRPRPAKAPASGGGALPWVIAGGAVALLVLVLGAVGLAFALRGDPGRRADPGPAKPPPPADAPADPKPNPRPDPEPGPPVLVNGQLPPDVLKKVKRATAFLRVREASGLVGMGSGFAAAVENEQGIVLTNAHVVGMLEAHQTRPPQSIEVIFNGGEEDERKFAGQLLGVDRSSDLAVVRIAGNALPTPLEVRSARNLVETQKVFVFGFPLGDRLGKEITVRESSVASLRKDNGVLTKVQVHGGMDPGNSGGPVVDARGDVVGVAVSGILRTQINFAVPGDFVQVILNGRIAEVGHGRGQARDGAVVVPVTMRTIDPLRRIKSVAIDVWTGDAGDRSRPPKADRPAPEPGDSEHRTFELTYDKDTGDARGEMTLPPLPGGKVYWVQPHYVNGAGQGYWAGAIVTQVVVP